MPTLRAPSTLITDPAFGVVPSVRAPQIELASRIATALHHGTGLAAEAGTGVGKTLAYAGEAVEILLADDNDYDESILDDLEDGEKPPPPRTTIVIATATKALQAQIVERELPRLAAGVVERMRAEGRSEDDIAAALKKIRFAKKVGKKNHLCFRRVSQMAARSEEVRRQLPIYQDFTDRVFGWVLDDAPEHKPLPDDAWRFGVGYCNTDSCKFTDACSKNGYLAAKYATDDARILVTNHAMVAIDLVIRKREGHAVLPSRVHALMLDEAHKFPDTLREQLTVTFSAKLWTQAVQSYAQLRFELDQAAIRMPQQLPGIAGVRGACDAFLRDHAGDAEVTVKAYARALEGAISDTLYATGAPDPANLRQRAAAASEFTPHGAFLKEMATYYAGLQMHLSALTLLCDEVQMKGRYVLATKDPEVAGEPPERVLVPIALASAWEAHLQELEATPVYISATLATGTGEEPFAPFLGELGRKHAEQPVQTFITDSPFDYATQALLYLPPGVSHRMPDRDAYANALVDASMPLLLANEGHAFILFTSRSSLMGFEKALGARDYPYPVLSQCSSEQVRTRGATLFKRTPHATLLGLRTFFEGVDVPGLGLSLVIIPQLPVPQQTTVLAAKRARYDAGYQAFLNVDVPIMLTDLRQMAGRLIRSLDDRGVVAILDPRTTGVAYGRDAVNALGLPTRRTREGAVVAYLEQIAKRRREEMPAAQSRRAASSDPFVRALSGGV